MRWGLLEVLERLRGRGGGSPFGRWRGVGGGPGGGGGVLSRRRPRDLLPTRSASPTMARTDIDKLARHFAAAGHPVRLNILGEVSARERRPADLAALVLVSAVAVRKHLRVLKDDGLVDRDARAYRATKAAEVIRRAAPAPFSGYVSCG